MFWNKNKSKSTEEKSNSICNTNSNLLECDIVSKIKEYQKEIDQLKIDKKKYKINDDDISLMYSYIHYAIDCEHEENLDQFVENLNKYIDIMIKIKKLNKRIYEEKYKLGIK